MVCLGGVVGVVLLRIWGVWFVGLVVPALFGLLYFRGCCGLVRCFGLGNGDLVVGGFAADFSLRGLYNIDSGCLILMLVVDAWCVGGLGVALFLGCWVVCLVGWCGFGCGVACFWVLPCGCWYLRGLGLLAGGVWVVRFSWCAGSVRCSDFGVSLPDGEVVTDFVL